jgi:hypothetical protein
LSEKLLYGKVADVKDSSWLYAFTFRAGISTARENFAYKGFASKGFAFISMGIFQDLSSFLICFAFYQMIKYNWTSAFF